MFAHHAAKMENQAKFDLIAELAKATGYNVEFRPTKYVRSWPTASSKPYLLQHASGAHIAAFANLKTLEDNLRARACC